MKFNIQILLIVFLLIVSLSLRIYRFEIPGILSSKWGDGTRDYLVAHYIRSYGERPLLGPFNLLYDSGLRDSPLYYYLLAFFLIPYDNLMVLGLINIIFQVLTIILIYLLTKTIFDSRSAFIAAVLFSFTPEVLRQSEYIWQPAIMQTFAYLSLYLLTLAFFKKNYQLLLISLMVLNVAVTLHKSALSWSPLFLFLIFLILKSQHKQLKYYLGIILVFLLSFILLHFPILIYLLKIPHLDGLVVNIKNTESLYVNSVSNYFANLSYNFSQILQVFSFNKLLILFQVLTVAVYFWLGKKHQKYFLAVAILFFLQSIIFSSFFNKNQLHYLTMSFGIFVIIVSVSLSFLIDKLLFRLPVFKLLFLMISLLFLIKITSQDFNFLFSQKQAAGNQRIIKLAADSTIQQVKKGDVHSFQVVSFAQRKTNFRYPILDTILMVPLEKKLNVKLAKISDDSPFTLVQINDDKLIFLSCFEFDHPTLVTDCSAAFLNAYPNYAVVKNIYLRYPLSIFLAKRNG